jgi:predicted RNA-binding protein with TRAM domain
MTRYREHREIYTRDLSKYSIYPSIKKPEEYQTRKLHIGQIIVVDVKDIDETGRGVSTYGPYTIKINGGGTVGDRAKIRITSIKENEAMADLIELL